MGLFDLFRKPALNTSRLVINLTEDGFDVNGTHIALPCNIDALKYLFGRARETVHQLNFTNEINYNYTWDKIGLYCYSKGGTIVHALSVRMNGEPDLSYSPRSLFGGFFTINGENWFEVMKNGETEWLEDEGFKIPVFKRINMGRYSVVSEFTNEDISDGSVNIPDDLKNIEVEYTDGGFAE